MTHNIRATEKKIFFFKVNCPWSLSVQGDLIGYRTGNRSGHQISCSLVSLHYLCDILSGRPVQVGPRLRERVPCDQWEPGGGIPATYASPYSPSVYKLFLGYKPGKYKQLYRLIATDVKTSVMSLILDE